MTTTNTQPTELPDAAYASLPAIPPAWSHLSSFALGPTESTGATPVIALHGLASSGRTMRHALAALASGDTNHPGRHIWIPDLLGFGNSPMPDDAPYDMSTHLAALDVWATTLADPGPYWLVGCSMGALIALAWAAREPERVRGVVAISAPLFTSPRDARRFLSHDPLAGWILNARWAASVACRQLCGAHGLGHSVSQARRLRGLFGWGAVRMYGARPWLMRQPSEPSAPPLDLAAAQSGLLEAFEDCWLLTWASLDSSIQRCIVERQAWPDLERLNTYKMPILFLHGVHDTLAPIARAREAAALGAWPLREYPYATHGLSITHGQSLGEEIARHVYAHERTYDQTG